MSDRPPPRLVGDERETLLLLWQYQRESVVKKVEGLDDDQAGRTPVGSGTTLRWLVQHLADAERIWVVHRFDGQPAEAAIADRGDGTLAAAIASYRATWAVVDAIVAAADLDDLCPLSTGDPVNLRWVLAHLLEETARHAGHVDILRELLDGEVGR